MIKATTLSLALILLLTAAPTASAQTSPEEAAVNEAVYRQANRITLRQRLADARAAQDRHALASAAKLYDDAWELVLRIGSGVDAERDQTIAGLTAVRMELARAAQAHSDYKEARTQVDDVLRVDPTSAVAIEFKSSNEKLLAEQRGKIPSEEVRRADEHSPSGSFLPIGRYLGEIVSECIARSASVLAIAHEYVTIRQPDAWIDGHDRRVVPLPDFAEEDVSQHRSGESDTSRRRNFRKVVNHYNGAQGYRKVQRLTGRLIQLCQTQRRITRGEIDGVRKELIDPLK